jgi:integrase
MRGSTRKRGKTWTAYWFVADPETVEQRQTSKGGFALQRDAEAHLDEVVPAVRTGTYVEPSKQLVGDYLSDEWLPAVSGQLRPLSLERYDRVVRTCILRRPIAGIPLRGLSGGHINALYGELADLSVNTRRLTHAVLRRALNDAVRWKKIARNPTADADPPKKTRTRVEAWTEKELCRFMADVSEDRLFAAYRVLAATGCRRGEGLGLQWRDLDIEAGRLRIERQVVPIKGGPSFGDPKSKARTIKLDDATLAALRRHPETQKLERDLAGSALRGRLPDLLQRAGRRHQSHRLREWFRKHRKAAGIPKGSLHVLRHTCATLALSKGIDLTTLARRLGDDEVTVLQTYSHLVPSADERAADVLASVLVDIR